MDQKTVELLNQKCVVVSIQSQEAINTLKDVGLNFMELNCKTQLDFFTNDLDTILKYCQRRLIDEITSYQQMFQKYNITTDITICSQRLHIVDDIFIFGKPRDVVETLLKVQGKEYYNLTCVYIITEKNQLNFFDYSKVYVKSMSKDDINKYMQKEKQFNPDNPYGLYGVTNSIVDKIEGDYFTMKGLPLRELYKHLKKIVSD